MSKAGFSSHSRDIREFAEKLGYTAYPTKKNHIKFLHPKGARPIFTSGTPSCPLSQINCKKDLERNLRNGK